MTRDLVLWFGFVVQCLGCKNEVSQIWNFVPIRLTWIVFCENGPLFFDELCRGLAAVVAVGLDEVDAVRQVADIE